MQLIAEEGPLVGLVLNLDAGHDWIVGRDPDQADFVLEDSSVSRKHCHIYKTKEGLFIKNLSTTNPTEVNDDVITDYLLKEGDYVKIGNTFFLFSQRTFEEIEELPQEEDLEPEEVSDEEKKEETIFEEKPLKEYTPVSEKEDLEEESFDTIYEDNEEQIPYASLDESNFVLKVLAGPNSGAEFGMDSNKSYILGKDPNLCDIVFSDLSVSKKNTEITIDKQGNITLEDLNSKNGTLLNAIPIKDKTLISPQDLVTVGTTTFLIVDQKSAQETIYSPAPTFESLEESKEFEEKEHLKTPVSKAWKKQFIPAKHLVFAGTFIGIVFIIFLSFFGLFKSKTIEVASKDSTDKIKKATQTFEDVRFSYNPSGGNLFLVGHVLTNIEKNELMYNIGQLSFVENTEDNVVVDELVWKNFNDVLMENENWRGISLHSPKAGLFVINGYLKNAQDAEALFDYINANFPYVDKLKNEIIVEEILNAQIQSMLTSKDMSGIRYQVINGELILEGQFDQTKEKEYNSLIKELNTTPGIHLVKNLALPSTYIEARVDLSSKYQITGYAKQDGKNFSIVANGKIATLGGYLDGMQITSIKQNTILLEKDGIKYRIEYNR